MPDVIEPIPPSRNSNLPQVTNESIQKLAGATTKQFEEIGEKLVKDFTDVANTLKKNNEDFLKGMHDTFGKGLSRISDNLEVLVELAQSQQRRDDDARRKDYRDELHDRENRDEESRMQKWMNGFKDIFRKRSEEDNGGGRGLLGGLGGLLGSLAGGLGIGGGLGIASALGRLLRLGGRIALPLALLGFLMSADNLFNSPAWETARASINEKILPKLQIFNEKYLTPFMLFVTDKLIPKVLDDLATGFTNVVNFADNLVRIFTIEDAEVRRAEIQKFWNESWDQFKKDMNLIWSDGDKKITFTGLWQDLKAWWDTEGPIKRLWAEVEIFKSDAKTILGDLKDFADAAADSPIGQAIASFIIDTRNSIQTLFSNSFSKLKSDIALTTAGLTINIDTIVSGLTNVWKSITSFFGNINTWADYIGATIDGYQQQGEDFIMKILSGISDTWTSITGFFETMQSWGVTLKNRLMGFQDSIAAGRIGDPAAIGSEAGSYIGGNATDFGDVQQQRLKGAMDIIKADTAIAEVTGTLGTQLWEFADAQIEASKETTATMQNLKTLTGNIELLGEAVSSEGKGDIVKSISGLRTNIELLGGAVSPEMIHSIEALQDLGMALSFNAAKAEALDRTVGVFKSLGEFMPELVGSMENSESTVEAFRNFATKIPLSLEAAFEKENTEKQTAEAVADLIQKVVLAGVEMAEAESTDPSSSGEIVGRLGKWLATNLATGERYFLNGGGGIAQNSPLADLLYRPFTKGTMSLDQLNALEREILNDQYRRQNQQMQVLTDQSRTTNVINNSSGVVLQPKTHNRTPFAARPY